MTLNLKVEECNWVRLMYTCVFESKRIRCEQSRIVVTRLMFNCCIAATTLHVQRCIGVRLCGMVAKRNVRGRRQGRTKKGLARVLVTRCLAGRGPCVYWAAAAAVGMVFAMATAATLLRRRRPTWAPVHGVRVVGVVEHSEDAFTQGLVWMDGTLWESTGLVGQSRVRRLCAKSGAVLSETHNEDGEFGEGLARGNSRGDELVQLTWRDGVAHVWETGSGTARLRETLSVKGERWGLATADRDGALFYVTDGTAVVRVVRRVGRALMEERSFNVTDGGRPVALLNELEVVHGELWANIWMSNLIARIDPSTGVVRSWVDCTALRAQRFASAGHVVDVLNGIAYDEHTKRMFVTGKLWPRIFQIEVQHDVASESVLSLNPFFLDHSRVRRILRSTGREL